MDKLSIAKKLNNREYGSELSEEIRQLIKETDIVIVYGASDDLMMFEGAIKDEVGCFGGGTAYLTKNGILKNKCEYSDCPYFELVKKTAKTIESIWDCDGYSWVYDTNIPHVAFDIFEDGEKYCRGIVFNLSEVE